MSDNLFLRNRGFLCKLRASAYEKARVSFRAAADLFPARAAPDRDLLRALDTLLAELETAFAYASDAIRGLKRGHVPRYRHDPRGVMEEEIVLCHFLEEMTTLARFLRKRVETDLKIRLYRKRIHRLQAQSPKPAGFMQGILDSLGELTQEENVDLKRLFELMERRYRVGDRLMEVLRDKGEKVAQPSSANLTPQPPLHS